MKKWVLGFSFLLIISIASVYFFIPGTKNESIQSLVTCNDAGVMRIIINEGKWQTWWPGKKKTDSIYSFKNTTYKIDKVLLNGFDATVYSKADSIKVNFQVISAGMDSSFFIWSFSSDLSANPFKKLLSYFGQSNIINNIESLTKEIQKHFDKEENVYGMKVAMQTVKDSTMISLKNSFDHYPNLDEIYTMIKTIKGYIKEKNSEEADYPMLNIHQEGQGNFETMVAIPTKTPLPSEDKFLVKRMILGNILVGEVKGGIATVIESENLLANYVTDHKKLSPAIPYQSLVTNRQLETDSTKWVTRLYYPVFY